MAMTLFRATASWHVYELTGSKLLLGTLGLAQFLPALLSTMAGGVIADRYERTRTVRRSQLVAAGATPIVAWLAYQGMLSHGVLFVAAGWLAAIGGLEQPSRASLLPGLVSREELPQTVTIAATMQSLAMASGPALAGVLLTVSPIWSVYLLHALLLLTSYLLVRRLPPAMPTGASDEPENPFRQMMDGAKFVSSSPVLFGCMALDMVAVVLGGAQEILQTGPAGFGILSASIELGALSMSIFLATRRPIERAGKTLLWAVAAYGVATLLFGLSTTLWLSAIAYALVGAADQISVVLRHTIVQLSTPDSLRGRVSAINMLFIHASNQLGAFESGLLAAATSTRFAILFGGGAAVLVAAGMGRWNTKLRAYRTGDRQESAG
jgi:MFS family permease